MGFFGRQWVGSAAPPRRRIRSCWYLTLVKLKKWLRDAAKRTGSTRLLGRPLHRQRNRRANVQVKVGWELSGSAAVATDLRAVCQCLGRNGPAACELSHRQEASPAGRKALPPQSIRKGGQLCSRNSH